MYQITQRIKFLLKSTNQHGVHSPFVYNLVTSCFYDKHQYTAYTTLKETKSHTTTYKEAKLLYRLSTYFNPKKIIQLGTPSKLSSTALRLGNPTVNILKEEPASTFLNTNKMNNDAYDLVLFQTIKKNNTVHDFESLLEHVHNDSIFIFNHIYNSKDSVQIWETIKTHPKVSVTIDTFFWGIIFFRKEQVREDFIIRV